MVALVKFDFDLWWQHRKKTMFRQTLVRKSTPNNKSHQGDKKDFKSEGNKSLSRFNSLYSHLNLDCTLKHMIVVIEAAVS